MQLNRFLVTAIKIGLGAVLFVPLFVSDSMFFPFITAKNFPFRIIVEILAALWIILALRDQSYFPKRSWLFISVAALLGVIALATVFGVDVSRSFWSNYERMEGLLGQLHIFAYFLILISVFKTEKDWWRFFHISFLASLLVGGYALLQLAGTLQIHQGSTRIDATLGNATYFAVYLLFHVFLALYYFLKAPERAWKVAYAALFLFEVFLLYQTATRGAILGFIGGIIIFGLLYGFLSKEKTARIFALGAISVIILAALGFYLARDSQLVQGNETLRRLRNISLADDTTQSRFYIWNMSFQAFKERPILGWGPENFTVIFSKYFDPRMWKQEPWFDRAHNAVFDWLVAGGVLGLAAYLSVFGSAFYILFKKYRERKILETELSVFAALLAGFFFQNLFVFDQLTSYVMLFAVLGYIHYFAVAESSPAKNISRISIGASQVYSAAALIALLSTLYFFNVKPLIANFSLISALESANAGRFEEAQKLFRRSIDLSPLGKREAREQYAHFSSLIASHSEIPEAVRASALNESIAEMKALTDASPRDSRGYLFLGSVLSAAGQRAEAIAAFEKALELSPKKQQIIFLVAQVYAEGGRYEEAVGLAKMGAELDPTYTDAAHNLITLQIVAGKNEDALRGIRDLRARNLVSADNLKSWASIFASRKNYVAAIDLYKQAVELAPTDIQMRINLAASYYESGQLNLAISEIQKAIAVDPSFKAQGEEFIRQLSSGKKP